MVAPTSFFSDYGGHIRILEETLALSALGAKITIATYYKGGDVPGIDIRRTAALPWRADYEVGSSRHKLAFDLFLFVKTLRLGLKIKPDLVHGHMHEGALIGGVVARILGIPLIFDYQGGLSSEMIDHGFLKIDGFSHRVIRRLERFICHLPDVTLTSSLRAKEMLNSEFGVASRRIEPLPDCVDTNRFDPQGHSISEKRELRRKLGIADDAKIVAYLGLLADYQGTPHLVEAAARLKEWDENVHFLIMGFPRAEQYRQYAKDLGVADKVTFTGKINYEDAPQYLSLGDIAVSAKMTTSEGSGKVLNYMAMAQPVVAYDTPVHREYLADLGVYAKVGDSASLAEEIRTLINDEKKMRLLGTELRKRAGKKYSWLSAGTKIINLYNSLT
jgi:glycosyltransferase involved in cell wall biosynthesis